MNPASASDSMMNFGADATKGAGVSLVLKSYDLLPDYVDTLLTVCPDKKPKIKKVLSHVAESIMYKEIYGSLLIFE